MTTETLLHLGLLLLLSNVCLDTIKKNIEMDKTQVKFYYSISDFIFLELCPLIIGKTMVLLVFLSVISILAYWLILEFKNKF